MFPKEHGAYGQLGFPLMCSNCASGLAWRVNTRCRRLPTSLASAVNAPASSRLRR